MYKKQLVFQKIACLFSVIAAAVSFIYSLGMMTDIYDCLYSTIRDPSNPALDRVAGARIYLDMQPFNKDFVLLSIGLILIACLLFLTNTHSRRKYYIGNYVATGLYSVAAVALSVWSAVQVQAFKVQYMTTVDFEALKKYSEMMKTPYIDNTFVLDVHMGVVVVLILSVVVLIGNAVWKVKMMKEENSLIKAGEEATV